MRFHLKLYRCSDSDRLTLNYPYPLSAAIYKVLQTADGAYSSFLHQSGYGQGLKRFKLFTFSELHSPFHIQGDRMILLGNEASLDICFFLPKASETFIKGIFHNRELEIGDTFSRVRFTVHGVETVAEHFPPADELGQIHVVLEPCSPLIVGRKNERGNYDYLSPLDSEFRQWLLHNWLEKYRSVYELSTELLRSLRDTIQIEVRCLSKSPQQRIIAVKQGTSEETKVKGFMRFALQVSAPASFLELALGAGLGLNNAIGFGCVRMKLNQ